MNRNELDQYRQRLLTLGRRMRGDLMGIERDALRQTGGEAAGNLSNAPFHTADLGTDTFEQEMSVSLAENVGMLIGQVSAAIDRIDDGTYGQCERCGGEIHAERLQAIPYTPYCVQCAREAQAEAEEGLAPIRV
jgi:DnaK suppressor protein